MLEENTIGETIERLARSTGASPAFVDRVRGLFTTKGISLESDGSPYSKALEQAFDRERQLRENAEKAQARLLELQERLVRFNDLFKQQMGKLRRLQTSLQEEAGPLAAPVSAQGAVTPRATPALEAAPIGEKPIGGVEDEHELIEKARRAAGARKKGRRVQRHAIRGFLVPGPREPQ